MKVAYVGEWHPTEGTYYRQRITMTEDEARNLGLDCAKGVYYLKLHQLYYIAGLIANLPEHAKAHKRLTDNNTTLYIR